MLVLSGIGRAAAAHRSMRRVPDPAIQSIYVIALP
jgi:hypothetical protein